MAQSPKETRATVGKTARATVRGFTCPECGHLKRSHVPTLIDGVALGPYTCKKCRRQCSW